jgi:hypothetical protein
VHKSGVQTVLAAIAGAVIGALVALQLTPGDTWWVGMLVGAVAGWVLVDPVGFGQGLARAWREATRFDVVRRYTWSIRRRAAGMSLLAYLSVASYTAPLLWLAIHIAANSPGPRGLLTIEFPAFLAGCVGGLILILGLIPLVVNLLFAATMNPNVPFESKLLEKNTRATTLIAYWNLFTVTYLGLRWCWVNRVAIGRRAWTTLCQTPGALARSARWGSRLVVTLVRLILQYTYTHGRLVALVCAATGSAVGYWAGSVLTGGAVGGICAALTIVAAAYVHRTSKADG